MATDTEQLVLSISADTKQISRAMNGLQADIKKTAAGIEGAFSSIGRTDPVGKMQQNLHRSMGAMQADANGITGLFDNVIEGAVDGLGEVGGAAGVLSKILAGAGGGIAGLLNPISLVTSVLTVALDYAVQYFLAVGEGGKEAEKAAKEANEELDRQVKLVQQVVKTWKDAPAAIKAFAEQQDALEQIRERATAQRPVRRELFGPLTSELQSVRPAIEKVFGLFEDFPQAAQGIKQVTDNFALIVSQLEDGSAQAAEVDAFLKGLIATLRSLPSRQAHELADQLEQVRLKTSSATSEVGSLDKALQKLGPTAQVSINQIISLLGQMSGPLNGLITLAQNLANAFAPDNLELFLRQMQIGAGKFIDETMVGTPSAAKALLKGKIAPGREQELAGRIDALDDQFATALAKLFQILPDTARINSAARTYKEQAEIYARHLRMPGGIKAHPAAPPGRSHHEPRERGGKLLEPQAADIIGVSPEVLAAAVASIKELEQLKGDVYKNDKMHVQLAGANAKADRDAAQATVDAANAASDAAQEKADADARAQENLTQYLRTLDEHASLQTRINEINTTAGLTAEQKKIAIEVETELQKAMNLAQQNNIQLTEQQIEQIRRKAVANAQATIAAGAITAAEKATAQATKEQTDATKQLAQQLTQMASSAVSGLIQDLRNGVDAGEAFNNMLGRILDSLIQIGVQSLFSQQGIGGIISSLLGVPVGTAHSGGIVGQTAFPTRRVSPLVFAGAPRMATGGLVGGEVPIIAHRGEMVIPKNMVGRGGGYVDNSSTSLGDVNIDMSKTGLVAADNKDAKQWGLNVQKMIHIEMVRESRPGGLLRRVPG